MSPELRNKIIQYNRTIAAKTEKAADLEIIIDAVKKLPFGQLKKVLTEEVLLVLQKYGVEI